jgi:hypothetical protein
MPAKIDGTTGIDLIQDGAVSTTAKLGNSVVTPIKTQMGALPSMVRLDGANGFGSTNTAIKRYTNVRTNQGADITYADSPTLGASFTINAAGVYAIMVSSNNAGTSYPGISLNTTQPATSIIALTNASERLAVSSGAAGNMGEAVWIGYLPAGSVVRPHTDIAASAGPASEYCTIARVA